MLRIINYISDVHVSLIVHVFYLQKIKLTFNTEVEQKRFPLMKVEKIHHLTLDQKRKKQIISRRRY